MRWFRAVVAAVSICSWAQDFSVPQATPQGSALHVQAKRGARATLLGREIKLFPQEDGSVLGIMPVAVTAKPGIYPLKILDAKGDTLHTASVTVDDAHFPKQNIVVGKSTKALTPLPGEMEAVAALRDTVSPERHWQEPFQVPTPDCMNSLFGVLRYHNGKPTGTYHKGLDLRSPMGRPIVATADGVVRIAKMFRLHGGTVGIDHGQGLSSIYIHMSKLAAAEGQSVKRGDVIGYVGSTGFATGPHLHWQIFANGLPVNPAQWIGNVPRCQ